MRPIIALLAVIAAGCSSASGVGSGKPSVVATTGMIADAATIIGGSHVEVWTMMGPGIDPHQYKASAGDLRRMQNAKLVLYNGLHLEGKMADVFAAMPGKKAVAVTHTLEPKTELRAAAEGYEGTHDPHVWFDVSLWMKCVGAVRDALCAVDPSHATDFRANADAYLKQLAALHEDVKTKAASIPKERRVLITAHDAFYYFGRAYDFEVRGLQGISTASEPSTRDVQDLARLIGGRKLPAIFGETSVPDRNIQAVRDAVAKDFGFTVKFVGERLYSDALGDANTPAGTYVGMVRHNVDAMAEALK